MSRYRIKKEKRSGWIIALIVIIVVAVIAFLVVKTVMGRDGYHNEGSFEKYAKNYYSDINGKQQAGTASTKFSYGEPLSTAVEYPKMSDDNENSSISKVIEGSKKNFNSTYSGLPADEKAALMIGYESYDTPEKAVSVAIHEKQRLESDDKTSVPVDKVYTFNFATKTGTVLSDYQIFTGNYLTAISKKVKSELSDKYDDVKTSALSADPENYSKYIMTDDGFKFFFDAGTVTNSSEGVVSVEISYDDMKSYMRDDIGERVVDPNKPMVAITYDDGPDAKTTPQLLDIYEKNGAVCTFFELGQNVDNVSGSSDILKRELEIGCQVGTHSYSHPNLQTMTDSQIAKESKKAKDAIKKASGQDPTVFRPPYGNGSTKIAKIFDLPTINWDVDTLDWKTKNASSVISQVKSIKNLDGAVVLMHSIYQSSVDATKTIVPYLQDQGYQLVTVSELLQYHYNETPTNGKWYGYTFEDL
ncbi:MAG: polysaccharide deacetylase family protein, partial [Eubacteriaceae bacterium]|nr:polysaccharide deacetylase family protein [Eubacteriaceae bacterium]